MRNNIKSLRRFILIWLPIIVFVIFMIASYYLGSFQEKEETFLLTFFAYYLIGGLICWGLLSFIWLIFSPILIKILLRIFLSKTNILYKEIAFYKQIRYFNFHLFFLFSPIGILFLFVSLTTNLRIQEIIGTPRCNYIYKYLVKYEEKMEEEKNKQEISAQNGSLPPAP